MSLKLTIEFIPGSNDWIDQLIDNLTTDQEKKLLSRLSRECERRRVKLKDAIRTVVNISEAYELNEKELDALFVVEEAIGEYLDSTL